VMNRLARDKLLPRSLQKLGDSCYARVEPERVPYVYAPRHRNEWLAKITEAGVRRRAEFYSTSQQLDGILRS
jgi:hypothetical protein